MVEGWQVIFEGPKAAADVVGASLQAAGLDARVITDTGDYFPGAAADTRVLVPSDQAEAASRLIAG
ncbi:MAG: hypothetical protein ACREPA_00970 [Candidatus Dormibacteraceae bacterium]